MKPLHNPEEIEAARRLYIPKTAIRIADKASDAVVYVYDASGGFLAKAFHGKAVKADWHHRFQSVAKRDEYIGRYFKARQDTLAYKSGIRAERKAKGHGLAVGDILRSSWGYEQTNIDYYEVTKLLGRVMVEIRKIGAESVETLWCQGKSVPMTGHYIGEPMRKAAKNGSVRIESYARAYKMTPESDVAGVKVYGSSNWSSYA